MTVSREHHCKWKPLTLCCLALLPSCLAEQTAVPGQTILQNGTMLSETPPDGAPTAACMIRPVKDASRLLVISGSDPLTFVFACGHNRPAGQCAVMTARPGSNDLPATMRLMTAGEQQNGWTCVDQNGITGWMRSERLAPLPPTPAITTAEWLGWWRSGKDAPGIKNDRLLITRSKVSSKVLHVSGRAYWFGLNDNVHFGQVDADASASGDTLHIVDGNDAFACVVDLVYHPATKTFTGSDNMNCGGMNVRFMGEWQRFTPAVSRPK